jgi:hypothetical protein
MSLFGRGRRMVNVGKTMGECKAEHPKVWALGEELADGVFETRTPYIKEQTRTKEGADSYAKFVAAEVVRAASEGTLEQELGVALPEPATERSLSCLGIAFGTRLIDLLEAER